MSETQFTPSRVALAALVVVLGLVGLSLVSVQWAVVGLGLFALAGGLARAVSPLRRAFVVRRRAVDVAVLVVLGAALVYLGLTGPLG